jgi:hypothetical protein
MPFDIWSEDDPAVRRLSDALRPPPQPVERPETAPPPAAPPPAPVSRLERVSQALARVRDGDLSAADALRKLLDDE